MTRPRIEYIWAFPDGKSKQLTFDNIRDAYAWYFDHPWGNIFKADNLTLSVEKLTLNQLLNEYRRSVNEV